MQAELREMTVQLRVKPGWTESGLQGDGTPFFSNQIMREWTRAVLSLVDGAHGFANGCGFIRIGRTAGNDTWIDKGREFGAF